MSFERFKLNLILLTSCLITSSHTPARDYMKKVRAVFKYCFLIFKMYYTLAIRNVIMYIYLIENLSLHNTYEN